MSDLFQCEECLRYFRHGDERFELIAPQPVMPGLLPFCACGHADCRAIAQARREEEHRINTAAQQNAAHLRQRPKPARDSKPPCRPAARAASPASECHRGMPPERDLDIVEGIGSSQKEFHAAVDVKPALQRLLSYFQVHFGEFIPITVLEDVCGHRAVNSRCSELRDLIPRDQDIDQQNLHYAPTGKLHSHYRLCLRIHSKRLERRHRDEANQEQFEVH